MRIFGLIVIAVLLVACGVIHPFGDKTIYQTYSVSDRLGLHWRYDCIRSALKPQGYEVERIIPEQNAPNFFDISQHGTRVAQIDMYQVCLLYTSPWLCGSWRKSAWRTKPMSTRSLSPADRSSG